MKPKFLSAVILLLGVVSFSVKAQDQPTGQKPKPLEPSSLQQPEPAASARVRSAAEKYFSDVELINQDGQKMRFYSDLLKDKVVVINTLYHLHRRLSADKSDSRKSAGSPWRSFGKRRFHHFYECRS